MKSVQSNIFSNSVKKISTEQSQYRYEHRNLLVQFSSLN